MCIQYEIQRFILCCSVALFGCHISVVMAIESEKQVEEYSFLPQPIESTYKSDITEIVVHTSDSSLVGCKGIYHCDILFNVSQDSTGQYIITAMQTKPIFMRIYKCGHSKCDYHLYDGDNRMDKYLNEISDAILLSNWCIDKYVENCLPKGLSCGFKINFVKTQ